MEITMPYIGRALSVNYYKITGKGGRHTNKTRPETEDWMFQLGDRVREHPEYPELFGVPVIVELNGRFVDRTSTPDLHNLGKVIMDALEPVLGINDKYLEFRSGKFELGCIPPELIISIKAR